MRARARTKMEWTMRNNEGHGAGDCRAVILLFLDSFVFALKEGTKTCAWCSLSQWWQFDGDEQSMEYFISTEPPSIWSKEWVDRFSVGSANSDSKFLNKYDCGPEETCPTWTWNHNTVLDATRFLFFSFRKNGLSIQNEDEEEQWMWTKIFAKTYDWKFIVHLVQYTRIAPHHTHIRSHMTCAPMHGNAPKYLPAHKIVGMWVLCVCVPSSRWNHTNSLSF